MKNSAKDMEFGLKHQIPNDAVCGWGARAIQNGFEIDLLWDRQDCFAIGKDAEKLLKAVINERFNSILRETYRKKYAEGLLNGHEDKLETLYEDGGLVIVANTNGSCGYVYLAAWVKPSRTEGLSDTLVAKLPVVGSTVDVKCNNIGRSVVVNHEVKCGFPMVGVLPLDPPDWYRKQNKVAKGAWCCCDASLMELGV